MINVQYRRGFRLLLPVVVLLAASCQTPPTAHNPQAYYFDEPSAPTSLPAANALYPLRPANTDFFMTQGDAAGQSVTIKLAHEPDDKQYPYRRALPGRRIEHLGVAADGSLVIGAVEDLPHNVITLYDPPMPLIPANLKPDQPLTFTSKMKIVALKNRDQVTDTGSAKKTITYDADQVVHHPGATIPAHRIHATYTATLKMAHVQVASDDWYSPKFGFVAERETETVTALFLSWTHKHTMILR